MNFWQLIQAIIQAESAGNPRAVSPSGAAGLMQIMPQTARNPGFGVRPLDWSKRFDPQENVRFGSEYFRALLNHYHGDPVRALVAYNWGPARADRWNGRLESLPDETRAYVVRVLNLARQGGGGKGWQLNVGMNTPPKGRSPAEIRAAAVNVPDSTQFASSSPSYQVGAGAAPSASPVNTAEPIIPPEKAASMMDERTAEMLRQQALAAAVPSDYGDTGNMPAPTYRGQLTPQHDPKQFARPVFEVGDYLKAIRALMEMLA